MTNLTNVILHAFNWTFKEIASKASEISKLGYKFVLVCPPIFSEGKEWWARYQPKDYRVLLSPLGNKKDFADMITALANQGVDVLVDIVLNHMANENRSDRLIFPGTDMLLKYHSNPIYEENKLFGDLSTNLFTEDDFNPAFCILNWDDPEIVQSGRLCANNGDVGLPDLKTNSLVIQQQNKLLTELKALGVRGFRIDAAKHLPTNHLNQVLTPSVKQDMFIFGEVIDESLAVPPPFLEQYLADTDHCAYDFPLHNTMLKAFRPGGSLKYLVDPSHFGLAINKERAVTFAITHDIPNNSVFRGMIMDRTDELLAYAYILGRDGGVPLVYSDHGEDDNLFTNNWKDAYKNSNILKMVHFHNEMHGLGMQVLAEDDCFLVFRRNHKGVVGINKCNHPINVVINTNGLWWHRPYEDLLSGKTLTITSSQQSLTIAPRSAHMWLLK